MNIQDLSKIIQEAYETEVTMGEAEKHAARFLSMQIQLSSSLKETDLDARMRKTGLKTLKAAVYLKEATKTEKKPSDVMLEAMINQDKLVISAQDELDAAEVLRNELQSQYDICREAHIFFRGISKGRFE